MVGCPRPLWASNDIERSNESAYVSTSTGKKKSDPPAQRTPWDMLLERRSEKELQEILDERLAYLRDRRKRALELSHIKSDPNEQ
ncbi:RNA polymerase-binding protein RbpA [Pseudoclavibacter soli]|uniref:RNA polymerase-binding protein RbpA n=1 Tax=Pseudoclavibacter soli TaxID=452623 RepID=UPI000A023EF2|nr:RNA polymerase-binding protein RbpA [Pseudoclavibacter soli]